MTGWLAVIIAVVALFAAITVGGMLSGARAVYTQRCPERDAEVDTTFSRRLTLTWAPGKVTGVARCTAFDDPDDIQCDRSCLDQPDAAVA